MTRGSGRIVEEWVRYWGCKRMGEGLHWLRELAKDVGPGWCSGMELVIIFNDCTLYFIREHL